MFAPWLILFLSLAGAQPTQNPWADKLPDVVRSAELKPTAASVAEAFETAWKADQPHGLGTVPQIAGLKFADDARITALRLRWLWRCGQIGHAEELATKIPAESRDSVALSTLIAIELSRGKTELALKLADRLLQCKEVSPAEQFAALSAQMFADKFDGFAKRIRECAAGIKAENGYPDTYLLESIGGLPEFFDAIGTEPVNQIRRYGSAHMPLMAIATLPAVDVYINGKGPYRFIVDTGGSIVLSINQAVADELKIKSLGTATVRGVSGTQESHQALVDDLRIGDIEMTRVVTRTFEMPPPMDALLDGIIGTGIFGKARMTLDFAAAELQIVPSSDKPASGSEHQARIIGDAKIIIPVTAQREKVLALIDSGAEAIATSPRKLKEWFPNREVTPLPNIGSMGVGQGSTAGMNLVPGITLEIFGRTKENVGGLGLEVLDSTFAPILGMDVPVLVGMPLLREMLSFTVDYPNCRVWVDWIAAPRERR